MVHNKKEFTSGLLMLVVFFIILAGMFVPLFDWNGSKINAMAYLDNLYNSISKGSAYYYDDFTSVIEPMKGKNIKLTIELDSEQMAKESAELIKVAGASATPDGKKLAIEGDYGAILANCMDDSLKMYNNDGTALKQKYPSFADKDERGILNDWNRTLNFVDRGLKKQNAFEQAKVAFDMNTKIVETAYNYYKVQADKIMDRIGIVIFSLAFYVFYTMWYGYAILFAFEGWGLKIGGH